MTSSIVAQVSVVYHKATTGSKKDHKLRPPSHHPGTDYPKETPNVPTIVDRITCQHTPIAFREDTPRQMSANQGS